MVSKICSTRNDLLRFLKVTDILALLHSGFGKRRC